MTAVRSVHAVCDRLFARYRDLPSSRKELFDRVLDALCNKPAETSLLLERFLWVLTDPEKAADGRES